MLKQKTLLQTGGKPMNSEKWIEFVNEADKRTKTSNGHYFETILKTRCRWCCRSPKAKNTCGNWFQTWLMNMELVLLENKVIVNE